MAFKKGQMQASQTSKKLKHWILQPTAAQLSTMFQIFKSCEHDSTRCLDRRGLQLLLELVGLEAELMAVIEHADTSVEGSFDFHAVKRGLIGLENDL